MMTNHDFVSEILSADERTRKRLVETPLQQLRGLSDDPGTSVFAKLENLQPSGSFKVRGVTNKLGLFDTYSNKKDLVAASTGNHGAALAYATEDLDKRCIIFVPESTSPAKARRIKTSGATMICAGHEASETETLARAYAVENELPYISPYNDRDIIAGQGTMACEMHRQIAEFHRSVDAIFVPVGGGGLISGIAAYSKFVSPRTRIIGCSPSNSKVMMESLRAGKLLDLPSHSTFSDGTAGGIEANSMTFDLCQSLVDRFVEVSETEIALAVRKFIDCRQLLIEGAAALALAAFLKTQHEWPGQTVILIISGGNVDAETLQQMLIC